ncbi:MAG: hypothetical protein WAV05_03925 [Anaerolineales bacterium]
MAKDKSSPMEHSGTERAAALILSGKREKRGLARLLPFMGPAFIASLAYMYPGNFATITSPIGGLSGCGY